MKKNLAKSIALGLTALMAAGAMMGCGSSSTTTTTAADTTAAAEDTTAAAAGDSTEAAAGEFSTDMTGTVKLAGSTSMEKLCEAMMESFMAKYPGISVTAEYTGSSAGLESLAAGSVDIGNASRELEDSEIQGGAVENVVALDGIAVIVDKDNTVADLTTEQLASIYTGEITNWSELGGSDESIVVIGRESASGTRSAFEELVDVKEACNYAQELDSTGAVLAKVASTPGAIGYVSLDVVDDSVNAMTLNGVAATEENILAGDYLLSRPFVMATMGEVSEQSEAVQAWFAYINSEEGKSVITTIGLIIPQ